MIHFPKAQLIGVIGSLLMASFISLGVQAEPYKIAHATYRMSDVRVEILKVDEENINAGEVRLIGDCDLCDETFKVHEDTSLHTAFYEGDMDIEVLEEQMFAKGVATVNTASMKILDINYMGEEY